MPIYKVETPDGKVLQIEGPADATDDELIATAEEHLAQAVPDTKYAKPVVNRPQPVVSQQTPQDALGQYRSAPGLSDLAVNGASFGLSDEIMGAVDALGNVVASPFTGNFDPVGTYTRRRDFERGRLDQVRADNPVLGTLAEVVGGFAGGRPTDALASAGNALNQFLPRARNALAEIPSLWGRIKAGGRAGAVGGAIAGFGGGEGGENSAVQAVLGAGLGSGLGAALPALSVVGANRAAAYSRLRGRDSSGVARQIVGDALAGDANTGASAGALMDQAQRLGVPPMLADTGENARGLLASVGRQPGASRTITLNSLNERQAGQADRIRGAITRDLGPLTSTPETAAGLHAQDIAAATAARDAAAVEVGGITQRVGPVADRAASGSAARDTFDTAYDAARARTRAAYQAPDLTNPVPIDIPGEFFSSRLRQAADAFYGDGGGQMPPVLREIIDDAAAEGATTRTLTNIDRRLADFAGEAKMSGKRSDAAFAERVRGDLAAFVDEAAPAEYRAALSTAKEARAEQGRLFETRDLPKTFGRDRYGNPVVGDATVPTRLLRPGAPGGDTADALIASIGPERAEAIAREEMRRLIGDASGMNSRQAETLLANHAEALQRFPALRADVDSFLAGLNNLGAAEAALSQAGRPGSTALELGASSLNRTPDEISLHLSGLDDAGRQQYAQGMRNSLADVIGRKVDDADKARALIGTPNRREIMGRVFGGGEEVDRFLSTMSAEQAANETYRAAAKGSPTALNQAFDAQTADNGVAETVLDTGLRAMRDGGSAWGTVVSALQKLREVDRFGPGEAGNRVRQSVASLLTETDPAELRRILAEANAAAAARRIDNGAVANRGQALGRSLGQGTINALSGFNQ